MGLSFRSSSEHRSLEIFVWAPSNRAKEYIVNKNVSFISGSLEKSIKMISPTHVILACPVETLLKLYY